MQIFWNVRCGSFAPEAVAAEAGLALERVRVEFSDGSPGWETLKALNPMRQVPLLLLEDGQAVTEAAAICLFLADVAPDARLAPAPGAPDRARLLRWLLFLAGEAIPSTLLESYPDRYTTAAAGTEEKAGAATAVRAAGERRIDRDWQILEEALGPGPYLLDETFSLVDPYIAMTLAWHRDPQALFARCPKLKRLLSATVSRPKIAPLWAEYEFPDLGLES